MKREEEGYCNSLNVSYSRGAAAAAVVVSSEGHHLLAAVAVSSEMLVCLAGLVALGLVLGSQLGWAGTVSQSLWKTCLTVNSYIRALRVTLGVTQSQTAQLGTLLDAGTYLG